MPLVSSKEEVSVFQKFFETFKTRIADASRSCRGFAFKTLMWAEKIVVDPEELEAMLKIFWGTESAHI